MAATKLGYVPHNGTVNFGVNATATGTHAFKTFLNGHLRTITQSITSGDAITLEAYNLNENYTHEIEVYKPDGTLIDTFEVCVRQAV